MTWIRLLTFALCVFCLGAPAAIADFDPVFPEPKACEIQPDDPSIQSTEKGSWNECEKWVWSCIHNGKEANLYTKECMTPRTSVLAKARDQLRLAAFFKPDDFATSNALTDRFLIALLTNPHYSEQIPAIGIRIFGAHFASPVNLENVTTTTNLVIDGSIIRLGLRMTNFSTTKNISVDGSNIRGSFYLMRSRIDGSLFIERGVFDTIDIRDARIGSSVEGTGSIFTSEFQLDRADIDGKLILTKARITLLKGWEARIGGSLDLRLADVRRKVDLTGSRIEGDLRMQDVTFGRQALDDDNYCDWDPTIQASYVLNELTTALQGEDAATALREVMENRPSQGGNIADNPCRDKSSTKMQLVRNEVLLRDMKIGGTLCIVDSTGGIAVKPGSKPKSFETISLDGTESKSTVLSWKESPSTTMWRAVNYKTGFMMINLNSQPINHFIDNLDLGFITFSRRDAREYSAEDLAGQSDERLVKYKCELVPATETVDPAEDGETQKRIIRFFTNDKSDSAQPFANVVARLEASSINTLSLRKALSDFRYRNACTYSEFSRSRRVTPWLSTRDAMKTVFAKSPDDAAKELSLIGLDTVCSGAYGLLHYMVYYGHEPWRLAYFIGGAILLFWLLLKLDSNSPGQEMMRRRFGPGYAFDNLIPLKAYRMEPQVADELPNRPSLRIYRAFHRGLGLLFAIMIFLFVYKAST